MKFSPISSPKPYAIVKSRKRSFSVVPVKAGIEFFIPVKAGIEFLIPVKAGIRVPQAGYKAHRARLSAE